ncbi:MAG: hypothetical protein EBY21_03730 [Alphaproteobacteria bacterium]|nr:hypothetical protein [Alphaproteobacteria bacterium]
MSLSLDVNTSSRSPLITARAPAGKAMQGQSKSLRKLDWVLYQLIFILAYPAFCLAEWLTIYQAPPEQRSYKALFSEARMNEHIALSYAFGMRRILTQCGRSDQTKRPS